MKMLFDDAPVIVAAGMAFEARIAKGAGVRAVYGQKREAYIRNLHESGAGRRARDYQFRRGWRSVAVAETRGRRRCEFRCHGEGALYHRPALVAVAAKRSQACCFRAQYSLPTQQS